MSNQIKFGGNNTLSKRIARHNLITLKRLKSPLSIQGMDALLASDALSKSMEPIALQELDLVIAMNNARYEMQGGNMKGFLKSDVCDNLILNLEKYLNNGQPQQRKK